MVECLFVGGPFDGERREFNFLDSLKSTIALVDDGRAAAWYVRTSQGAYGRPFTKAYSYEKLTFPLPGGTVSFYYHSGSMTAAEALERLVFSYMPMTSGARPTAKGEG